MGMEALGNLYNKVPIAAGVLISMKDCAGIQFTGTGDDTFTLSSAATEAGSPSTLATITNYYTNTSTNGSAEWVEVTQAAADNVAIASGSVSFYVDAADLPAAAEYVKVAVGGSGLVQAEAVGLLVARAPANLRPLSGSSS
jgi:hypothetical protein